MGWRIVGDWFAGGSEVTLLDKLTLIVVALTIALVIFDYVWRSFSFPIRKAALGVTVTVIVLCCIAWWMGGVR